MSVRMLDAEAGIYTLEVDGETVKLQKTPSDFSCRRCYIDEQCGNEQLEDMFCGTCTNNDGNVIFTKLN